MTVEELIVELNKLPKDSIVMYRHNKYGRIDIDKIDYQQELLYSGRYIKTATFEGTFREEE